jgi:hypothetical protein
LFLPLLPLLAVTAIVLIAARILNTKTGKEPFKFFYLRPLKWSDKLIVLISPRFKSWAFKGENSLNNDFNHFIVFGCPPG